MWYFRRHCEINHFRNEGFNFLAHHLPVESKSKRCATIEMEFYFLSDNVTITIWCLPENHCHKMKKNDISRINKCRCQSNIVFLYCTFVIFEVLVVLRLKIFGNVDLKILYDYPTSAFIKSEILSNSSGQSLIFKRLIALRNI